eukprot:6214411-Pleurochrysis_carterae.AAC.1
MDVTFGCSMLATPIISIKRRQCEVQFTLSVTATPAKLQTWRLRPESQDHHSWIANRQDGDEGHACTSLVASTGSSMNRRGAQVSYVPIKLIGLVAERTRSSSQCDHHQSSSSKDEKTLDAYIIRGYSPRG